jgi:hypothetical protein
VLELLVETLVLLWVAAPLFMLVVVQALRWVPAGLGVMAELYLLRRTKPILADLEGAGLIVRQRELVAAIQVAVAVLMLTLLGLKAVGAAVAALRVLVRVAPQYLVVLVVILRVLVFNPVVVAVPARPQTLMLPMVV